MLLGFLLKGMLVGIIIAVPAGPVGVLCVRRTIFHGRLAGFVSGLGAASADAVFGIIAGFGLTFTFGIWARLREKSPTRALATLGFAFVGLTSHAIGSALLWQGGATLVALSAKDQTAAAHAWSALAAVNQGIMATGNAFTGAAVLIAGWAIVATGAMTATLGWVAVIAGALQILQLFSSQMALMGLGFLSVIIWLAWGGAQLRR